MEESSAVTSPSPSHAHNHSLVSVVTEWSALVSAEHGVSSAKPFNAYNYARNVPRSTTASLEILPPAHTHTHTHRLVRNATNVRSFFVSADSVYTSKFTATTHATLSSAKQCKFVC